MKSFAFGHIKYAGRQWVKDIIDNLNNANKRKAWDMWLACYTEDEIAKVTKVARKTINKWISAKKQEVAKMPIFPETLQIYNIWSGSLISIIWRAIWSRLLVNRKNFLASLISWHLIFENAKLAIGLMLGFLMSWPQRIPKYRLLRSKRHQGPKQGKTQKSNTFIYNLLQKKI